MISPAMYSSSLSHFLHESTEAIVGKLTSAHTQTLQHSATRAWGVEVDLLKQQLSSLSANDTHVFIEMYIPRVGRRADVVLTAGGIIFVIEFKVGAKQFYSADIRQCHGYALDLKNFHKGSHEKTIIPLLLATNAKDSDDSLEIASDKVAKVICISSNQLSSSINHILNVIPRSSLDIQQWLKSGYLPTPTIIEAAQALYSSHNVAEITRSEADKTCIVTTSKKIDDIIDYSKAYNKKSIYFVTGVPGAGKTLVGLNIASKNSNSDKSLYSVFLSGNGPLVSVLQEALARDQADSKEIKIGDARRKTEQMIQNIHRFRDSHRDGSKPPEQVAIFDEAQRAWNKSKASDFMQKKRGMENFSMSEPEFLIEVMNRHEKWSVIVALIGGGQEIHTGEIGLIGWIEALENRFTNWDIYYSSQLFNGTYVTDELKEANFTEAKSIPELHLSTSMRSFRAEHLSNAIHHLVDGNHEKARTEIFRLKGDFPIRVTRSLKQAKKWITQKQRGNESAGVLASSGALRLKPEGIFVKNDTDPKHWFLNDHDDVRSSNFLEDIATEFQVQGLELDWCLVAWDADYRYIKTSFEHWNFKGTKWQKCKSIDNQRYLKNAYRVLLTRARQGMVIYIPEGNVSDRTRSPDFYDGTYQYLQECGIKNLGSS